MWDFTQIYLFFLTEPLAALMGLFPLFQERWILSSESTLGAGTNVTALEMQILFSVEWMQH